MRLKLILIYFSTLLLGLLVGSLAITPKTTPAPQGRPAEKLPAWSTERADEILFLVDHKEAAEFLTSFQSETFTAEDIAETWGFDGLSDTFYVTKFVAKLRKPLQFSDIISTFRDHGKTSSAYFQRSYESTTEIVETNLGVEFPVGSQRSKYVEGYLEHSFTYDQRSGWFFYEIYDSD